MALIRRIIEWFKRLFRKLFKKNNNIELDINNKIKNNNNNKSKANINTFNDSLPSYFIIDNNAKDKLLYGISIMKNLLLENHNKLREKEEKELINGIKNNKSINLQDGLVNLKEIESIASNLDYDSKKNILDKYDAIIKQDKEFKNYIDEIDKTIDLIKKKDISIVTENAIYRDISNLENEKLLMDTECVRVSGFNKLINSYIDTADIYFINTVIRDYNKVNYVTVANTIIDNNYEIYKQLEEDFRNHRHNKYYYEREVNKIKQELNRIKKLKNKKEVNDHIQNLKKELYTKSKDKYDLLYNNEVFMNFEKECDNLLDKINVKVVDIKKEENKVVEENNEKNRYIENILLRFHDLELARKLILMNQIDEELNTREKMSLYVDKMYDKFNNGQDEEFNFLRNKTKTELVILFNDINKVSSILTNEPYIMVEHINFRMEDLVEAVDIKNKELANLLMINKVNINEENNITDKMDLLQENYNLKKNNPHVLKKTNTN